MGSAPDEEPCFLVTEGLICKLGSLVSQSRKREEECGPEGVKISAVHDICDLNTVNTKLGCAHILFSH